MKLMRSRFRFLSLLLVCCFLAAVAFCAGSALKSSGISLSSLTSVLPSHAPDESPEPVPSSSPGSDGQTASPSDVPDAENESPGVSPGPDPEYNIFGL